MASGTGGGTMLLQGCGKMGSALLQGWLKGKAPPQRVVVVEPGEALRAQAKALGAKVEAHAGPETLPAELKPDALVLAIKPQSMDAGLAPYARFGAAGTVVLSIAAGKTVGYFERTFGAGATIVRSMPNTPAAVGRGMTVLYAPPRVGAEARALAERLMAAVGETAWVAEEALIDAVTALSGGGPAYVFLLIEAMAAAGAKAGLDPDLAMRLARATVSGSGELARLSPEPAAQLRQNVTSPGGTTKAALDVLMAADGVQPLFDRAIAAATRRARELAS